MGVQYLVIFYMLVSIALTVFNFAAALSEGVRGRAGRRRERRLRKEMGELVSQGVSASSEAYRERLLARVRSLAGLEALDHALEELSERDGHSAERYLRDVAPVLERVAGLWERKGDLERAYLCYVLRRWYVARPADGRLLHELVLLARDGTFYVRQNSLEALAALGDAHALMEALRQVRSSGEYHHPKLLTETLLSFSGDAGQLAFELCSELGSFEADVQVAIVNWLRMSGRGDRDGLLALMDAPDADVEVRLACMRYFMSNPWQNALPSLVRYADEPIEGRWQFQAVAATALGSYPDREGIRALEGCLTSPVWFVRRNAAASLRRLGVSAEEALAAVGADAYARDMVRYQWGLGGEAS